MSRWYNRLVDKKIALKVEEFFNQFRKLSYKKGEILIRADDDPSGIFYLKEGKVRKYAISKKGEELIVNIFKPGAFFPMSWAMNDTPNSYFYEAETPLEVFKAPKDKVLDFVEKNPDVLYNLLQRVYSGTDGMTLRMLHLMGGGAYARLITEILINAKRFGKASSDGKFEVKIAEKDLAAQTGMTRETISRELKILKEKGLIDLKDHCILINDLEKLEEELAEAF